jgi:hypothetical protein
MFPKSRSAVLFGLMILITSGVVAQDAPDEKPAANPIAGQLEELQRELKTLRAAGKTKEADDLEQQAQQALSGLLLRFRQTQAQTMRAQDPATHRLTEVKRLVAQVRDEVGQDAAEALTKRLAAIERSLKSGELDKDEDDQPEVHVLRINAGVALPEEFTKGRDHRTVGYASVELNYSTRPLILVLVSGRPTLWNIKRNDARLHAILRQDANQEILGAGDCPVMEGITSPLRQATGRNTATDQSVTSYDGGTLTIGPSNRTWLGKYVLPRVEAVAELAESTLTSHRVESLKHIRFRAVHRHVANQPGPSTTGTSFGEFTIAGPIANSLEPLPQNLQTQIVSSGGDQPLRFALDSTGRLVMAEQESQTFKPIPIAAKLRSTGRFRSFCLDSKRNRIVLAPYETDALCAYDVAVGKWARLGDAKLPIGAIVYYTKDDRFFAASRLMRTAQAAQPTPHLLKIDGEGKVESQWNLSFQPADPNKQQGYYGAPAFGVTELQLAFAGDRLALICGGSLLRTTSKPLKLLDRQSGKVIYEGPLRVHHDEDPATVLNRSAPPAARAQGLLARVDRLIAKAEQVRNELATKDAERAKEFETRLDTVRQLMRGRNLKREQEQTYTVSLWPQGEARKIHVHMTDTSGPSKLILVSSRPRNEDNPVTWQVTVADDTQLNEIILGSTLDQVEKPPQGISVQRGNPNQPAASQADTSTIRYNLVSLAPGVTRLTIGPESGQWRAELATRELDRLIENSGIEIKPPQLVELEKHRFFAVTRVGSVRQFAIPQPQADSKPSFLAEFTVRGPLIGTEKAVTLKPSDQILGVTKERIYVLEHGRGFDVTFASIEVATDKRTTHNAPQLRHTARESQSTLDPSRQRMYVSTRDNTYAIDLATLEWKPFFATRRFGFNNSMIAYNHAADMLYDGSNFGRNAARRFNFRGALLDSTPRPIRTSHRFSNQASQSFSFGHYAGELVYLNGKGSIRVLDLDNGDVVYEGALREHVAPKPLSAEELSALYEKLANKSNESDELMWQMTAAGNDTVHFLDEKLPESAATQVDIAPLIKQLDSEDFAKRNAAFKKLQQLGSGIEPAVRRALKEKLPVETRARLDRLIKTWESAAPQNGDERQHVSAVTILHRIGSSPARALLREMANGRGSPVARRAAREVLESTP